MNNNLETIGNF